MSEAADFALWNVRIAQTREERKRIFRFRFDNHFSEYGRWPNLVQPSVRSIREAADEVAVLFFADSDGKVVGATRLRIGPVPPELRTGLFAGRSNGFREHALTFNHPELGPRVPLVRIIGGEASEKWFEAEFPEVEAQ